MAKSLDEIVERAIARRGALRLTGLRGAGRALVAARLVLAEPERCALYLAADARSADAAAEDLRVLLGEPPAEQGGRVRPFPRPDTLPYDRFSPQPFLTAQRMDVLYRLLAEREGLVVVAPWTALALRVPSRDAVRAHAVEIEVGKPVDRDELVARLVGAGYARMPLVEERGELAVRGGIVDLFPPQRARPVRIELLGDDVESIREFDPASQRSQERLGRVVAPPPRELLPDRALLIDQGDAIRRRAEEQGADPRLVDETLDALLRGHLPPGAEALAPWVQPPVETFFDFLPDGALVLIDEPEAGRERVARFADEAAAGAEAARSAGRVVAPPEALLLAPGEIEAELSRRRPVSLERLDVADDGGPERIALSTRDHEELARELTRARTGDAALLPLVARLERWLAERWRVVLTSASLSGAERLRALLGSTASSRGSRATRGRPRAGAAPAGPRCAWRRSRRGSRCRSSDSRW